PALLLRPQRHQDRAQLRRRRGGRDRARADGLRADQSPRLTELPRDYNAAVDLLGRNLGAGRGGKTAFIDDAGSCTYAALAERADRVVNVLHSLDIRREERIAIAMLDSADWAALFLGAIKTGIVPVALNTLLTSADYEHQLNDSRARAVFVSEPLLKSFESIRARCPDLK